MDDDVSPLQCWREYLSEYLFDDQLLMSMSRYPFVYSILIIPLSIIRWWGFAEEAKSGVNSTAAQHNLAALAVFGLSGFLNVILLLTTRPRLGLFNILMRIREGPLANPRQDNPEAARPP